MAVVANFTADVESGESPLIVTFTDTSSGLPTNWHWDFGDGFFSTSQNPSHIYTVDGNYTVSLLVFDNTSTSQFNASNNNKLRKRGNSSSSEPAAWNNFVAASFVSTSATSMSFELFKFAGALFQYESIKIDSSIDLTSLTPNGNNSAILRVSFTGNPVNKHGGGPQGSGDVSFSVLDPIADGGNVQTVSVLDVSAKIGSIVSFSSSDINGLTQRWGIILGLPAINQSHGYRANPAHIIHYINNSKDTETKINFIAAGNTPVANFFLIPSTGRSPLSVDFTNQSSDEDTYSWRRRISGSGNPFVEFSTEENPTEIFDKDSP